jgi:hypothetical protein
VWNICETIYDRKKVDKTWTPVILTEAKLHSKWFYENTEEFKKEFINFIRKIEPPAKDIDVPKGEEDNNKSKTVGKIQRNMYLSYSS